MGRAGFLMCVGAASGLALLGAPGHASLYSPDDTRFVVPVGEDGKGRALEFEEFKRRLATVMNAMDPRIKANGKVNSDREAFLKRVEKSNGKKLSVPESAALTADLIRVGHLDEALNQIKPRVLGRNPSYLALTTLAHVFAARGDWREAVDYQLSAILDAEMPAEVKGLKQPQRDWFAMLDRDYVLPYYQLRLNEVNLKPRPLPEDEDVYPLFPVAERNKPHDPVRFVNDDGVYQPGAIAADQRSKLPPDAIAIVQQLLFWYPSDTRLYWLLAELYAADGQIKPARIMMDEAVSGSRQYGNRKVLAEHRTAVRAADDALPPPPPVVWQPSMRTIGIYFGVIGVVAVLAFVRAMARRAKGDCGPIG